MLLKVMKGGLRGSLPPWVILGVGGVGGHCPLGQSYRYGERGTQPAGCWPKNGITAAAANPEILPLEFLLGDDPGSWIAEWMDRRVVRELSLLLVTLPPSKFCTPLIAFQQHP